MNFSNPQKNIDQLGLGEAAVVADLGAGTGAYAIEAGIKVGPDGKVYAVDVQKGLLENISDRASRENISNIEIIWGNLDNLGGSKIADGVCDSVLVCNILFQLEDKDSFAKEVKRILRPNGTVLVVDWEDSFSGMGPDASLIFTEKDAISLFEKAGFSKEREINAGENHYGFILRNN